MNTVKPFLLTGSYRNYHNDAESKRIFKIASKREKRIELIRAKDKKDSMAFSTLRIFTAVGSYS